GQEVRLTEQHPVFLASGAMVPAVKVKIKDRVRTRQGSSSIVSVERLPYTGTVYNFDLGTPEELAQAGAPARTMFAGGFLVGDNSLQVEMTTPRLASGPVLERLPKAWHKDYRHSLARQSNGL
ncbi:MAG TPA: Hint domain-containing protein, partial [Hyalangium sp.]|nr:Hint domain-containing protein [Hyalangium sp.]